MIKLVCNVFKKGNIYFSFSPFSFVLSLYQIKETTKRQTMSALEQLHKLFEVSGVSPTASFSVFMRACKNTLRRLLTPTPKNQLQKVLVFLLELQPTFNKETLILLHCTEQFLSIQFPNASVVVVPALWKGQYISGLPYNLTLPKPQEEYKNEHALNKALSRAYMKHHLETEIQEMQKQLKQQNSLSENVESLEKLQRYQGFLQHYTKSSKKDDMCDAWAQIHSWQQRLENSGTWKKIMELYPLTDYFKWSPELEMVSIDFGTSNLGWWRGTIDAHGKTNPREWKVVDLTETLTPPPSDTAVSSKKRKRDDQDPPKTKVQKPRKKRKAVRKTLGFSIDGLDLMRKRLNVQSKTS